MTAVPIYDEIACSHRIRDQWRICAVDDDYLRSLDRHVLVGGRDPRNFGFELKANSAGGIDLNRPQFHVQRLTLREGVPPFVLQHTNPPGYPWCFRVFPLRIDALRITADRAWVTMNEQQAEAFFAALCLGIEYTDAHVSIGKVQILDANRHGGWCITCHDWAAPGTAVVYSKENGKYDKCPIQHFDCRDSGQPQIKDFDAEGLGLVGLHTDLVAQQIWSPVALPTDYSLPPLQGVHAAAATRVLKAYGVLDQDDAPVFPTSRPLAPVTARRYQKQQAEAPIQDKTLARAAIRFAASLLHIEPEPCDVIEYDCSGHRRRYLAETA